jgi:hypothetical protein
LQEDSAQIPMTWKSVERRMSQYQTTNLGVFNIQATGTNKVGIDHCVKPAVINYLPAIEHRKWERESIHCSHGHKHRCHSNEVWSLENIDTNFSLEEQNLAVSHACRNKTAKARSRIDRGSKGNVVQVRIVLLLQRNASHVLCTLPLGSLSILPTSLDRIGTT